MVRTSRCARRCSSGRIAHQTFGNMTNRPLMRAVRQGTGADIPFLQRATAMALTRPTIEDILPLLVSTYMRGHLVPFLVAGMSAPKLALWDDFVTKLECEAGIS